MTGFHDPAHVPLARRLAADWRAIRDEARALRDDDWLPYTEDGLYAGGWELAPLLGPGRRFDLLRRTPAAARALDAREVLVASFSKLRPGTVVAPHRGEFAFLLRLHLGLLGTSDRAALRVRGETRPWRAGEALVFDDTVEHDAWNRSDEERVVLMVDVLRPFAARRSTLGFLRDRRGWRRRLERWYGGLLRAAAERHPSLRDPSLPHRAEPRAADRG